MRVNFVELEERASQMSREALYGSLLDILNTLDHADAMDRELGSDNGGRYRDEASVYRRELARRGEPMVEIVRWEAA